MKPTPAPEQETVLITGASSGIGLALAREFASHGHPLVIVAPVPEEIDEVAASLIAEYGVRVHAIASDLSIESAADEIFDELMDEDISVEILVNNAGVGQHGNFWETPLERDIDMLRINIEAVVRMTKRFLPTMVERRHGRILNTASIAGFEPGPTVAVYHATKAFVLSLSEALATELDDAKSGVTLTALCPGPVDTDFFPKANMEGTTVFQKGNVMAPKEVAETAYKALMSGERVIIPGVMNKALVFGRRFLPESGQARMNEKMYEEVPAEKQKRERGDIESKSEHPNRES